MDIYPVIMLLRRGQLVLSRLIFDRFYRRLLPLVPFSLRLCRLCFMVRHLRPVKSELYTFVLNVEHNS